MATARDLRYQALQQRLCQLGRVAVAFSGGVDSTFCSMPPIACWEIVP